MWRLQCYVEPLWIEPVSPVLAGRFFTTEALRKPSYWVHCLDIFSPICVCVCVCVCNFSNCVLGGTRFLILRKSDITIVFLLTLVISLYI